ncbi:MAG TPA: tetratricopeptide repeat protein [Chloroflexia bacterium]|jgi:tetratricopeptide (TPR) repeat protein
MNIGALASGGNATIVGGDYIISQAATPSIRSLHQLRAPVSDFVGRQAEIDRLVEALSEATRSGTAAITGMRGLGGIGKTELAYAVAQRLADIFPDAQLLLEMRGTSNNPLPPEQALQTVIRAFEPLAQLPDDLNGLRAAYVSLLTGKRVLVLADDAKDARQVEPLRPPPGCALLLTSRQHFNLPGMETLDLGILPQPEAEQLLLEIYPAIGSTAPRMAQLCGRLPLALRLSASVCANSARSIEHHLKELEDERARLAPLRDPDDPNTSVEASFLLSYTTLDPIEQQVLCQLAVFPANFDLIAAEAVVQVDGAEDQPSTVNPRPLEDLFDLLYRRSLLEWDRQTERYSLHDLIRVFALARLDGEEAVRLRHAQHYVRVAAVADELFFKGGQNIRRGLELFDQERANIDAGWNWVREHSASASGSTSKMTDELLLDYSDATAYVGALRYNTRRERVPHLEEAIETAQRLGHRVAEASARGNLGMACAALGETHKAIEYYEQSLEITREVGDRRGEGGVLGNLGLAYSGLGETHKAIEYYEQHLQIAREIGHRRGEANALGNLGIAYSDLGETHKAIEHYERQLEITREIGDRYGEANALGNLGIAYSGLGETHKAIEHYEQSLEFTREVGDRRGEATALANLGNAYAALGETHKAIEHYEQSLEITREVGDRHVEGSVLGNLGVAYADLGETHKAIEYYEQRLAIAREIDDRRGEAYTRWNLGALIAKTGDLAKAIDLLQMTVDYEREIGHVGAEEDAAELERLRKRLAGD